MAGGAAVIEPPSGGAALLADVGPDGVTGGPAGSVDDVADEPSVVDVPRGAAATAEGPGDVGLVPTAPAGSAPDGGAVVATGAPPPTATTAPSGLAVLAAVDAAAPAAATGSTAVPPALEPAAGTTTGTGADVAAFVVDAPVLPIDGHRPAGPLVGPGPAASVVDGWAVPIDPFPAVAPLSPCREW